MKKISFYTLAILGIVGAEMSACGSGFNTETSITDTIATDSTAISKDAQIALDSLTNDTIVKSLSNDTTDKAGI